MSLGKICEFTLNKGSSSAWHNREKQKTEADRDRTSKKACDEQPAGDQLYKRNPQAQRPQQEMWNPGVLIRFEKELAGMHLGCHDEHLVNARHREQ